MYILLKCVIKPSYHISYHIISSKACGPDNIPNWLLKDFSDNLAIPLCKIINSSLAEKQLPNIWKCANVTPIPKNSSITNVNNDLRPISLTPAVSKIAEDYVVDEHIKPAVLRYIGHNQYGYSKLINYSRPCKSST